MAQLFGIVCALLLLSYQQKKVNKKNATFLGWRWVPANLDEGRRRGGGLLLAVLLPTT
jgi:hypothetical protein